MSIQEFPVEPSLCIPLLGTSHHSTLQLSSLQLSLSSLASLTSPAKEGFALGTDAVCAITHPAASLLLIAQGWGDDGKERTSPNSYCYGLDHI